TSDVFLDLCRAREVVIQESTGHAAQGDHAIASTLALVDAHQFLFQADTLYSQVAQFLSADAGGIKDFKNSSIAITLVSARIDSLKNSPGLLVREHLPRHAR